MSINPLGPIILAAQPPAGAAPQPAAGTCPASPPPGQPCQDFHEQTAEEFLGGRTTNVNTTRSRMDKLSRDIRNQRKHLKDRAMPLWKREDAKKRIAAKTAEKNEAFIILWLQSRDAGTPAASANNLLSKAADTLPISGSSPPRGADNRTLYWPPQISLILASELESPFIRLQLAKFLGDNGWRSESNAVKREKLALEQIYTQFLQGQDSLSLMQGENIFRRALIAKNSGDTPAHKQAYNQLLEKAKKLIGRLATKTDKIENFTRGSIPANKAKFVPGLVLVQTEELRKHFAWANLLMGNILMLEADSLTNPEERLKKLEEAMAYTQNTKPLDGFSLLAARKLLADNLTQQGYIKKFQNKEHLPLFAKALCHLDYVQAWNKDYHCRIGADKNPPAGIVPKWLVNTATAAKVSKAKLLMVLAGDINFKTDPEVLNLLQLSQADRQDLGQGKALEVQKRCLEKLAKILSEAQKDVAHQDLMDLRAALAENLARQAFIAKDLVHSNYSTLMSEAKGLLGTILKRSSPASPLTRAVANLWMAKILSVEAGDKSTFDETMNVLTDAEGYITNAINSGELKDSLLSSAHHTNGEILLGQRRLGEAQKELELALQIHPHNYEAEVSLADAYNQQELYASAIQRYTNVETNYPHHLITARARLGKAEARMRDKENYSSANVKQLEELLFGKGSTPGLFSTLPPGSFLHVRALNALHEAYSNKSYSGKIILIGNKLLGTDFEIPDEKDMESLETALGILINRSIKFNNRFKAQLYLRLAEALSWVDNFDEAQELLDKLNPAEISSAPQDLRPLIEIIGKDSKIKLQYHLLAAILRMRKKKRALIIDRSIESEINQSKDPDLITQLILAKIEGQSYLENFTEMQRIARENLSSSRLEEIRKLFRGRIVSFFKFRFELWKIFADALRWDKKFDASLRQLGDLHSAVEQEKKDLPAYLVTLFKARIAVSQGDTYKDRDTPDYENAKQKYETAIGFYPNVSDLDELSRKAKVALIEANIGLGEIYHFAGGHQDDDKAMEHYEEAKRIIESLPERSAERERLMDRLYNRLFKLQKRLRERPVLSFSSLMFRGANDGRKETQIRLKADIPLSIFFGRSMAWLHVVADEQIDLGAKETVASTYLGLEFVPIPDLAFGVQGRPFVVGEDEPNAGIQFFRRPHLKTKAFYWNDYFTLGAALDFNFDDSRLNYYHGSAMLNFAWTELRGLRGLRIGAEVNSVPYDYLGEPQRRDFIGAGARYELDIIDEWWKIKASMMGLFYPVEQGEDTVWQTGLDIGVGSRWTIFDHVDIDLGYNRQQTPEYPIDSFSGMLFVTF